MAKATDLTDGERERLRLTDEVEQLHTALEASSDEVDRLIEERDRLLRRVTGQARELQAANSAYAEASTIHKVTARAGLASQLRSDQNDEELRVAFEKMQVLTEKLEIANTNLHEMNMALDQRVEERTVELEAKNRALVESEMRFRTLVEGIPQLVWRSCDQGCWTWSSPQWQDFTGQTETGSLGLGWLDAVHPDDRATTMQAWEAARPHGMLDVEFRVRRASDGAFLWHHTRSVPVRNEDACIVEWLGTTTDVQELKELQERQGVLVAELQHRTRNLMGVVRSVSDKTARSSADLQDFRIRFRDRLESLARVQGLLSRLGDIDRVSFDDLIRTELSAMNGGVERVTLDGPSGVRLRSSTVQTLAMAIHELATNAVKYGALGQPSAHLAVTWSLERAGDFGKPWLHVDWRESGVAMPSPGSAPSGTGHGRELIERALPYQLSATTSYSLGADGVHCTISIPVSENAEAAERG